MKKHTRKKQQQSRYRQQNLANHHTQTAESNQSPHSTADLSPSALRRILTLGLVRWFSEERHMPASPDELSSTPGTHTWKERTAPDSWPLPSTCTQGMYVPVTYTK